MEGGAEGEYGGDEVDDALVVGEELGDIVTEGGEEDVVEDTNERGCDDCLVPC